jgi:hypothetical protein
MPGSCLGGKGDQHKNLKKLQAAQAPGCNELLAAQDIPITKNPM